MCRFYWIVNKQIFHLSLLERLPLISEAQSRRIRDVASRVATWQLLHILSVCVCVCLILQGVKKHTQKRVFFVPFAALQSPWVGYICWNMCLEKTRSRNVRTRQTGSIPADTDKSIPSVAHPLWTITTVNNAMRGGRGESEGVFSNSFQSWFPKKLKPTLSLKV